MNEIEHLAASIKKFVVQFLEAKESRTYFEQEYELLLDIQEAARENDTEQVIELSETLKSLKEETSLTEKEELVDHWLTDLDDAIKEKRLRAELDWHNQHTFSGGDELERFLYVNFRRLVGTLLAEEGEDFDYELLDEDPDET